MTRREPLRPRHITTARILYLLGGTINVVGGVIELGPDARPAVQAIGSPLIVAGLATLVLVVALRAPRRRLPVAAAVVSALMIASLVVQATVLGAPAMMAFCVLPLLAAWAVLRREGRAWAGTPAARWRARVSEYRAARRRRTPLNRMGGAIGAVGLVAGLLVAVGASGVVAAVLPCSLPAPAMTSGLITSDGTAAASATPTGTIPATDGTPLAYYAFVPPHPVASLVFFHGSGANSTAGYLPIGTTLQAQGIAVYLFDIRGHGASGGPRGDTPGTIQLERDAQTAFTFVGRQQPGIPEFIGGHSAGAGVVLNSAQLLAGAPAGYVFLAPDFGLHSGTERENDASNFATICQRPLVAATITNGLLGAHTDAVVFAYTVGQIEEGLIPRYTAAMAIAQNPENSADVLAGLHAPIGVWVGADDEVFSPSAVVDYAQAHGGAQVTAAIEPGATHLSILDDSAPMGEWIRARVDR